MKADYALAKLREASATAMRQQAGVEPEDIEIVGEGYDLARKSWWVQTRAIANGVEHHDLVSKSDDSPEMARMSQMVAA